MYHSYSDDSLLRTIGTPSHFPSLVTYVNWNENHIHKTSGEFAWEESNFLTCLAANQSYFLSYLALLNIGFSSLNLYCYLDTVTRLQERVQKTFIQNIFHK